MSEAPPPLANSGFVPYAQPAVNLPFRDRRTGLTVFGIIMICLGVLAGCGTLSAPLGMVALSFTPGAIPGGKSLFIFGLLTAALMYGAVAAGFIWTGIGSIKARRWVRPIVLVFAWLAIVGTIVSVINSLITLPAMRKSFSTMNVTTFATPTTGPGGRVVTIQATTTTSGGINIAARRASTTNPATSPAAVPTTMAVPPMVASTMTIAMIGGIVFLFLFGIGLPGVFIWFYRKDDTRKTMEHFDERTRWTDGVPVPVLGISIAAVVLVGLALFAALQQLVLGNGTDSGRIWIVVLPPILAVLFVITAVQCYRLRTSGWLLAVLCVIVGGVAWSIIVWVNDPRAQLEAMGIGGLHIDAGFYDDMVAAQKLGQVVSTALVSLAAMAYLMWCRKFFAPTAAVVTRP